MLAKGLARPWRLQYCFPHRSCLRHRASHGIWCHLTTSSRDFASQHELPKSALKSKLPNFPARTRFAPSPTGYLHLGSLRTALFNYLLAKRTGGQFLLRIEDTDKKRTVPDAEQRLLEDLRWAGLYWDEGPEIGGPYGPYKQSERTELYHEHAEKLVQTGRAYRCFCSAERLAQLAEQRSKLGLPTDYDRTCANISKEESDDRAAGGERHVVRLRVPDVYPGFRDLIYGKVGKAAKPGRRSDDAYEDPILLKSDGLPTYHLANVVDDHEMKITHVIRGTEWLPSTPKHLAMYEAFGWQPPEFAHVGLLVDEHGNKLSKRNFDTDIASFRDKLQVFPETLVNFVTLLGWSHGRRSDVMDLQELVNEFTLKFTKGETTVTLGKLWFLQNHHAQRRAQAGAQGFKEMVEAVMAEAERNYSHELPMIFRETSIEPKKLQDYVSQIVLADAKNYRTAKDFVQHNKHFFVRPVESDVVTALEGLKIPDTFAPLYAHFTKTIKTGPWDVDSMKTEMKALIEATTELDTSSNNNETKRHNATFVYKYLRGLLAAGREGVGIADMMVILGPHESEERLLLANKLGL